MTRRVEWEGEKRASTDGVELQVSEGKGNRIHNLQAQPF